MLQSLTSIAHTLRISSCLCTPPHQKQLHLPRLGWVGVHCCPGAALTHFGVLNLKGRRSNPAAAAQSLECYSKLHSNMQRKMIIARLVLLHTQFSCLCSISSLSRQAGRLCLRPGITLWILIREGSAQFPGQVSKSSSKPWEASDPWMRDNGPPAALLSGSLWLLGSTKANISEKRARRHRQALTAKPDTKSG